MSKLIDLISKLGQQSAQPIGFGALTGRVEAAPTMALIGSASASEFGPGIVAELPEGVDAIVFLRRRSEINSRIERFHDA